MVSTVSLTLHFIKDVAVAGREQYVSKHVHRALARVHVRLTTVYRLSLIHI